MMIEEFQELTGFYPSEEMYKMIEAAYLSDGRDKQEFCKAYKENKNGLAEKIAREVNIRAWTQEKEREAIDRDRKNVIKDLKKRLEIEQEWKSVPSDSKMNTAEYEGLLRSSAARRLSDAEATDYIFREFGFAPAAIRIVRELDVCEVNRHRMLRKTGTEERPPVYGSTDWNYIRFDVRDFSYEVVDGYLHKFDI